MPALIGAAVIGACILGAVGLWTSRVASANAQAAPSAPNPAPDPASPPALNTGLLSFRRGAAQLSADLNLTQFAAALQSVQSLLNDQSCLSVTMSGQPVADTGADRVVLPASNQKILVAAVANDLLGPDYTFTTTVVGPAPQGGVVAGDVYLVGGGDPLLVSSWYASSGLEQYPPFNTTPVDDLVAQLKTAGVTQIQGMVRGDGSRYDDEYFAPGWGDGVAGVEGGPYDALMINDSRVQGDSNRGANPADAAAREFVRILTANGITVTGGAGIGTAPAQATQLAAVTSQPLSAVIAEMLTNSDNNTAEMMVKEIGIKASNTGTRQAGLDAIKATIGSWGIDTTGLSMADGSGLSLDDRATCRQLNSVLDHAGFSSAVGQGLAIAGSTGTLKGVFADTAMAGVLRGKTGTLTNPPADEDPPATKSLSGFYPIDGDVIAYSLILNGPTIADQGEYRPVWAALGKAFASYPAVASASALGPR